MTQPKTDKKNSSPFAQGEPRVLKTGAIVTGPIDKPSVEGIYTKAKQIPDNIGNAPALTPQGVVIHYTASSDLDATVDFFKKNAVDIHFLIGKDGSIVQMVPCNKQADHAGESEWKNLKWLNKYFLGIEVVCLGPVKRVASGKFNDGYDRPYKGKPRDKLMLQNRFWDPFTIEQEKALKELVDWMLATYKFPVDNIVGHHEVAPGRKIDPGGCLSLSMEEFRGLFKKKTLVT